MIYNSAVDMFIYCACSRSTIFWQPQVCWCFIS